MISPTKATLQVHASIKPSLRLITCCGGCLFPPRLEVLRCLWAAGLRAVTTDEIRLDVSFRLACCRLKIGAGGAAAAECLFGLGFFAGRLFLECGCCLVLVKSRAMFLIGCRWPSCYPSSCSYAFRSFLSRFSQVGGRSVNTTRLMRSNNDWVPQAYCDFGLTPNSSVTRWASQPSNTRRPYWHASPIDPYKVNPYHAFHSQGQTPSYSELAACRLFRLWSRTLLGLRLPMFVNVMCLVCLLKCPISLVFTIRFLIQVGSVARLLHKAKIGVRGLCFRRVENWRGWSWLIHLDGLRLLGSRFRSLRARA